LHLQVTGNARPLLDLGLQTDIDPGKLCGPFHHPLLQGGVRLQQQPFRLFALADVAQRDEHRRPRDAGPAHRRLDLGMPSHHRFQEQHRPIFADAMDFRGNDFPRRRP